MADKKINKKDIAELLSQWSQGFTVFVPSKESGSSTMTRWDGKDTSFLDWYRNTVSPAKANFLPPVEEMFRFQKDGDGYKLETPVSDGQRHIIFGIRPCDASALVMLDMTFQDGCKDPYYFSRREKTLLVGLSCTKPYDSCFCTSLGSTLGNVIRFPLFTPLLR